RGKHTDKTAQHGHERLSTFGVGIGLSEAQWRGVVRQLVALGHLRTEGEFHTLALSESARAVLKGDVAIVLREPREAPARAKSTRSRSPRAAAAALVLDAAGQARFQALKLWRAAVARE